VEGTGGEGEVGFGALSRLVAAATVLFSVLGIWVKLLASILIEFPMSPKNTLNMFDEASAHALLQVREGWRFTKKLLFFLLVPRYQEFDSIFDFVFGLRTCS